MSEDYLLTAEQMELIRRQGEGYGPDTVDQMENEWAQIIEKFHFEMENDTPVNAPEIQKLVKRWDELISMFAAHDPEIIQTIKQNYDKFFDAGDEQHVDPKVFQYIIEASKVSKLS